MSSGNTASNKNSLSGFNWYAIQTLSNLENKVKKYLDKFVEIEEMGDYVQEVLMPVETISEVRNGKKTQKVRKLYPGYLYIRMKLYDDNGQLLLQPWYFVKGIEGVIGFIGGQEDRPSPLKPSDVRTILDQVKAAQGVAKPKIIFEVGEEVKVTNGPFLSQSGRVEEVDIEQGRLKISVSVFGRFVPVELEFWEVERAEESK